jgi:uncharacterized protein
MLYKTHRALYPPRTGGAGPQGSRVLPAVVLTGPRRAGKTWLLQHLLPEADYYLLEDPTVVARLRADPQGFLDDVRLPVILDEVQNAPEIFALVRARLDARQRRPGQWFQNSVNLATKTNCCDGTIAPGCAD